MYRVLARLLVAAVVIYPVEARITRIVIENREPAAYKARSFKEAGAYERLAGHAYGELDPKDPLNAIITDLQFAPRNARGMVEYSATFLLVRPIDLTKASGVLLYEVPNRGNSALVRPAPMPEYFKRGHVVLTSGWQGDIAARDG